MKAIWLSVSSLYINWNQRYGYCSYFICCVCFGLFFSPTTAMTYFFWLQSTSCLHFAIHCTFNLMNCDMCILQCIWVGPKMKEEKELILYPNKNGTVADLLEEARKQVELSENGSGKLRYISTLERQCFIFVACVCFSTVWTHLMDHFLLQDIWN